MQVSDDSDCPQDEHTGLTSYSDEIAQPVAKMAGFFAAIDAGVDHRCGATKHL